ncbi:MAG: alpha/beta fold hydrolase, partial [Burkholderiaceae bacterium]
STHYYKEDQNLMHPTARGDRPIRIWQAGTTKAVLLGIHGGMSHSGDYETVGSFFRQHEVTTVSFDLHGHGTRQLIDIPSFEVFIDDVVDMLEWVRQHYPTTPLFIVGHSMGALIATHLALSNKLAPYSVSGIVLSSPYYANAIPVPAWMIPLSRWLSRLLPTAKVPMEDLTPWLTHDREITERHVADSLLQRRGSFASMRFGRCLLDAQAALHNDLSGWRLPVFAVVAGDDRLADASVSLAMLRTIPPQLLDLHEFTQNFHENFNELNRDAIFAAMLTWMRSVQH